jgi:hypothetical protein
MRDRLLTGLAYVRIGAEWAGIVAFLLLIAWIILRPLFAAPDI